VRIERVILEDHGEVAVFRCLVQQRGAVGEDVAAVRGGETGNDAQQRGLAAAGRPEQGQELAAGDGQVDAAEHLRRAEGLGHSDNIEPRHLTPPFDARVLAWAGDSGVSFL
jgi:hypothetical protein